MKKTRTINFAAGVLGWVILSSVCLGYSGGDGSAAQPYQIANKADLLALATDTGNYNKSFILAADIDLAGESFTAAVIAPDIDNTEWSDFQGTQFTGVFDGNGKKISYLTITGIDMDYVGLFGCIGPGGQIKNLIVVDADIQGRSSIGGLAGYNYGTISSCYATGSVSGNGVGGLVGGNSGTITTCYATVAVGGSWNLGGLVGYNYYDSGTTTSCFWDVQTSGQSGSAGGKGLTTEQMKTLSIYQNAGWAGKGWVIHDGVDYPRLSLEGTGGVAIPLAVTPFAGSGTEAAPYRISTTQEFALLSWYSDILDKHIRLEANLDLSGIPLYPIGDLGKFTGVFDGDDHTISNAVMNQPESSCVGLFGRIGQTGEIKNLGVVNVNVKGGGAVGGLVGYSYGTIRSCYVTGLVSGNNSIGGLVGSNIGTIYSCYTNAPVTGSNTVGGLVGFSNGIMIRSCYSTGSVNGMMTVGGLVGANFFSSLTSCHTTGAVSGYYYVGGLVGENYGSLLTACYASGSVSGIHDDDFVFSSSIGGLVGSNNNCMIISCYTTGLVIGDQDVGGLIGRNGEGMLISCYATGSVSGSEDRYSQSLGGLVGNNGYGALTNCYATGSVNGTREYPYPLVVGGLVGSNFDGVITACFWDIQTSGVSDGVGNVDPDPTGATGKTTAQMQTRSTFTFAGWDFSITDGDPADWWMPGNVYPRLAWEAYGGGSGTETDPYQISSVADFLEFAATSKDWDKCFILTADIDLGGQVFTRSPIAPDMDNTPWNDFQGTAFTGVFNGNGHRITHLTIHGPDQDFAGLFGVLGSHGQIWNLAIEDASILGRNYVGGLVGENEYGDIMSICIKGIVSGNEVVGGLVGWNYGTISSCYSLITIEGSAYVGGMAGWHWHSTIVSSYAAGTVSGDEFVGGLVGWSYHGVMNSCFWDTQTSNWNVGVGFGSMAGSTGKTTSEMQTQSTFTNAGWDFTNEIANGTNDTWRMCADGVDYPPLNWESTQGDFACPDGVNIEDLDYFVGQWLLNNCTLSNNYCGGADMDISGTVNLEDYAIFARHWLEGV